MEHQWAGSTADQKECPWAGLKAVWTAECWAGQKGFQKAALSVSSWAGKWEAMSAAKSAVHSADQTVVQKVCWMAEYWEPK